MRSGAITLLVAAMLPLPAAAQQDAPALPKGVVAACLADTPRGDLDPDCIGAAANECQQEPGGSTTLGISECLMAEHAEWDAILNEQYKQMRDRHADDRAAADSLRAAQRAWIAWRDAECAFQYDSYGGGSMRTVASAGCQMGLTARRALELRAMHE
ncbi:lysozyme inhibitor LprI family protein [Paracoccus sp. (in: a-proteobacteria)]|uniref:lysozyme inhibitor LprI family protein n=1 Tax=Paracoccus sp. TaxID=267 RepID=UPI0035AFB2A5